MSSVAGRRIYARPDGAGGETFWPCEPGDYWFDPNVPGWFGQPPIDTDLLANLTAHSVTEHPDGSISVQPSILVHNHLNRWHGWLENGVWREARP